MGKAVARRLVLVLMVALPAMDQAGSAHGVVYATEWTQILNNAELLRIQIQDAKQLAVQMRQYENMVRQARRLDPRTALAAVEDLRRLVDIISTSRGVAVGAGDVDERFREEFPGFDRYAEDQDGTYEAKYRSWNETNREGIKAALRSADLQAAQFSDEAATLRAVERDAVSAEGMMQIMQAGARIATHQARQMMELRALLAGQIQMQGNAAGAATDRQAHEDAELERWKRQTRERGQSRPVGVEDLLRR